ncbi:MAG: oxidoreductase [Acidimicrobiales bacterium]|jgi:NAD(P)-dependent dehydrogenase (short-subunit alcohol dehydrogenase family)|nr:oxidoreductase [Acidimicrobiales bacterium]MDP6298407.1 oxidoreductase [Acidimicrobiales bacterium]HJM27532.1 oxidoreductase [Acidimicrobiales bacterium]HJM98091.1 oxidoreductase [Acidimicrobiales bacterium]
MGQKSGWTFNDVPDQTGKVAIVTGGNSGIGLETARYLLRRGATVVLAVRNSIKGSEAMADLTASEPGSSVEVAHLDLADLASIEDFANWFKASRMNLDLLINNAGIMGVPRGTTIDGFELQFGTNHLGHFALTGKLLGSLLENKGSRVVNVASNAHRQGRLNFYDLQSVHRYGKMRAYAQSKLANLVFTAELDRRLRRAGRKDILSVAAHPGMAESNIVKLQTDSFVNRHMRNLWDKAGPYICQTASAGAIPTLRAATDPAAEGNDYFGPSQFMQIRGPAVKVQPKKEANDVHDGRALWEQSIELTGVNFGELDLP